VKWVIAAAVAVVLLMLAPLVGLFALLGAGGAAGSGVQQGTLAGVDPVMTVAYQSAAGASEQIAAGCVGVSWTLLAAIAQVESAQAVGRQISSAGDIEPWIIGPALDGGGAGGNVTAVRDSDGGRWDRDQTYDRAVGPFQFLPSSWVALGVDGNDDGVVDPQNAFDAAFSAVAHLCGAGHVDLAQDDAVRAALLAYNHSEVYVQEVLAWSAQFEAAVAADPGAAGGPVDGSPPQPFTGSAGGCVVPDPTGTGGCVTPATAWLLRQVAAHVHRGPVSCWDAHEWNPSSDHPLGKACDYAIGQLGTFPDAASVQQGWTLAIWLKQYAAQLQVSYVIWQGKIWSAGRAGQGWRPYTGGGVYDPNDPTGGHYDHVHVSLR
jgi:hypothetical protein